MSNATELLRRVMDAESHEMLDDVLEEIEIFLSTLSDGAEEPVAQVSMTNSSKAYVTAPNIPPGTLLYRHPPRPEPARKPMTEEEIANCIPPQPKGGMFHMVDGKFGVTKEWLIPLVRAIEQHHGIGGSDGNHK